MKKTRHLIKRKIQKARHALLRTRAERPALFAVLVALAFSFGGLLVWGGVTITLSINSANLESGLVLHYTFDDGKVDQADPNAPSDWYNNSWTHRKPITIQSSLVEETVTNFPVLIQRTDTDWRSTSNGGNVGQTNGNDILFTSSSGAKLDHEIEHYNPTTGELVAWVKVPSVSSTVNTELYIYYGNTSASNQQNPTGVWSNSFQAVYHMAEQSGTTLFDSTLNNNDATKLSATDPTATTGGQIDGAQDFDGTNDNAEAAHKSSLVLTNAMTLSGWINPDALGQSSSSIIIGKDFNGGKQDYALAYKPDGTIRFRRVYDALENTWDLETTGTVPLNTWTYVTGVFDGSQMRVYLNGTQDPTTLNATQTIYNSSRPLILGSAYGVSALNRRFDGTLDELRISNVARSVGWVKTEYNNQSSPSTFSVVGTEEARSNYSAITIKEYGEFMGSTTLASPVGDGPSNHGPYVAHNKQWIFFSNGSGGFVYKTKDLQGGEWSEPSSSYSSYIGQGRYFNITFDGTHFHLLYRISGNGIYRRFTPNADGTMTAGSTHTVYSDATWSLSFHDFYITTDYQGRPWAQFEVTDGINYKPVVVASTATDGTWSTRSGFPYDLHSSSTSEDHGGYPSIVELGNDKMIFTWRDVINNRMSARVWDNGVWGPVESTGLAQGSYGRTSTISPASGEVMVNTFTTVAHRAADGTWSSRSPGGMNTSSDNSFSKAGNTVRLWDDNGGNDIRYKETSDAGLTWGPLTTFATATGLSTFSSSSEVDAGYHSIVWSTGINPYVRFAGVDGKLLSKNRLEGVIDRSGNANDGVVNGGAITQVGRIGQAAELNGDDGYISVGNIGANIRSISFWIKPNVLSGGLVTFNGSQSININPGAAVSWYNNSWTHRKPITIQSSLVEETVTNFPVLIQRTDTDWRSTSNGGNVGQTNGNDILFTSSAGAKLDHEIEYYNATTGELIAWVKVPSVSSTVNTDIYIYYGNAGSSNQQNATGVWDNNYAGVWHFKEDPSGTAPQMLDSTANSNDGTSNGSMTSGDQVTGQIDGSLDFDDVDDVIRVPNSTSTNITGNQFTISAWVYPRNMGCGSSDCDDGIISKAHESASNQERYHLGIENDGYISVRRYSGSQIFGGSANAIVVNNQWQYIVGRYDGATLKAYYNGNEVGSTAATGNITSSTEDLIFGKRYGTTRYTNGRIDEPRVSNIARSNGWIKTEYNNQSSPSTFYTVGTQEPQSTADIVVNGLVSPTVYIDGSTANTTLSPNTWHHVTVTTSTNINASAVEIGRVGSGYFDGVIDEVRIYSVTLPGSDIDRIYHLGATTTINTTLSPPELQVGLVGHWPFDGMSTDAHTSPGSDGTAWTQETASAAFGDLYSHSSVVYDNKMWVIGGHDGAFSNKVWYSTDGISWTLATNSPGWSAREGHSSVVYDNKMWVIGGVDGTNAHDDVWYSTDGVTWTEATSTAAFGGRYYHLSLVYDNKMWVIGGYGNGFEEDDVWYSTNGITWTQATAAAGWSTRVHMSGVVYDGRMWIMGGYDFDGTRCTGVTGNRCRDVWYSTNGATWTQATSAANWEHRNYATSLLYDNKMWVIGGLTATAGGGDDAWYSTNGVNWTEATGAIGWTGSRGWHSSVVFGSKMWVIGGFIPPSAQDDVWSSNLNTVTGGTGVVTDWSANNNHGTYVFGEGGAGPPATITSRVNASSDDAEESATGVMNLTSSDLELVFDGSNQVVGMRFNSIAVPAGATITDASVQFTVDEINTGATSLTIYGQDIDNAPTFTTATNNISSRTYTTASVAWNNVPAWGTVGVADADQRTPNISSIVQEIVDRGGWASGNSVVIIIEGTGERTAEAFEGGSALAPLLSITYEVPGTAGGGVATGRIGQGLKFSGTAGNIATIPDHDSLDIGSGSFTYGAWIKSDSFVGDYDMPMYKGGASAGDTGWDMELGADGWGAGISDGSMVRIVFFNDNSWSPPYLETGEWYHLMAVVDRSNNEFRAYRNGALVNTTSITGFGTSNSTHDLTLGGRPGGDPNLFNGVIDDMRVYNRALPADEINRLYHLGATTKVNTTLPAHGSATGPIAHWTFDGPTISGSTVEDVAGTSNGTIYGATPVPGKIGQGLVFDGTNDYLEMPNSSALRDTPNNEWAMSAWIYPTETGGNSRGIVRKSTGGDGYYMRMTSGSGFQSLLRFSTGFVERIAGTIALNEWTHVVMTYDGTTRKHYLNGEEVGSWNEGGTLIFDANVVRIGANTSLAELFNGIIDEVRLYNRTLSAEEIQRLYKLGN